MERDLCERIPLACPVCASALALGEVAREGPRGVVLHGTLACAACAREYPILDGVPILVADLAGYIRDERRTILRRRDLPAWAEELLDLSLDEADPEWRRARTLASYAGGAPSDPSLEALAAPLGDFVDESLARHARSARLGLDAGAAAGMFTRRLARHVERAVGLEAAFDRARRAREETPEAAFIAGFVEEPPFAAASFDAALALNLLDVVARPRRLLEVLHACLRPGGVLILTTPFEYATSRTELEEWIEEEELRPEIERLFEVLDDRPRIPWHLPISERHHDVYFVRGVVARRRHG